MDTEMSLSEWWAYWWVVLRQSGPVIVRYLFDQLWATAALGGLVLAVVVWRVHGLEAAMKKVSPSWEAVRSGLVTLAAVYAIFVIFITPAHLAKKTDQEWVELERQIALQRTAAERRAAIDQLAAYYGDGLNLLRENPSATAAIRERVRLNWQGRVAGWVKTVSAHLGERFSRADSLLFMNIGQVLDDGHSGREEALDGDHILGRQGLEKRLGVVKDILARH